MSKLVTNSVFDKVGPSELIPRVYCLLCYYLIFGAFLIVIVLYVKFSNCFLSVYQSLSFLNYACRQGQTVVRRVRD